MGSTADPGSSRPEAKAPPADGHARRGKSETRVRILDAARLLFGQQGFSATTVKDIARLCGITDGALYYYFRSKREILDALWGSPWTRELLDASSGTPVTADSLDDLTDELLDGIAAQQALLRVMFRQALAGDRTALALRDQTMAAFEEYLFLQFRTSYDSDRARELTDSLAMLFLGMYHNGEIELGEHFGDALRTPEFRQHVKALVRLVIPVEDENLVSSAPCAP
jgi:AcrR family transcriptional regulator